MYVVALLDPFHHRNFYNFFRPDTSPWGNFKGTWQLPDKIPRELANLISGPQVGASRWTKPPKNHKRSTHRTVNTNKEAEGGSNICCPNRVSYSLICITHLNRTHNH
jgi:hypothetical protein